MPLIIMPRGCTIRPWKAAEAAAITIGAAAAADVVTAMAAAASAMENGNNLLFEK